MTRYIIQHCDPLGVPHSWIAEIADEPHPFLGFCSYISKAKRFATQEEAERAAQDLDAWQDARGGDQHILTVVPAPECRPSNVIPLDRAQERPDTAPQESPAYYDALETLDRFEAHAWQRGSTFKAWTEGASDWQAWLSEQPAETIIAMASQFHQETGR